MAIQKAGIYYSRLEEHLLWVVALKGDPFSPDKILHGRFHLSSRDAEQYLKEHVESPRNALFCCRPVLLSGCASQKDPGTPDTFLLSNVYPSPHWIASYLRSSLGHQNPAWVSIPAPNSEAQEWFHEFCSILHPEKAVHPLVALSTLKGCVDRHKVIVSESCFLPLGH